jgi:DNA-binding MarR family transcriptional regulator
MSAKPRRKAADMPTAHLQAAPPRALEAVAGGAADDVAGSATTLDGVIHERARLAIVTALASGETRTHTELRDLLQLSDGNLSVHARKLEDAGYVVCTKEFSGRTPRTSYKLTPAGRKAFDRYLAHLDALVSAMKNR